MRNGITLKLNRYLQGPGCCAVAAAASIANFFDKDLDYEFVEELVDPDGDGLYTPDIASLMNRLGFTAVKVVTANIEQFDFKWQNLSKNRLLDEIKRAARYHPDIESREVAHAYANF